MSARTETLFGGIRQSKRAALARAITLIESSRPEAYIQSQLLLSAILRDISSSHHETFRIGISGPPGVGKSTFIEALGSHLLKQGLQVAVLTVDPSSSITGGSILGDKTRMPNLSKDMRAYVRPSPSAGTLGGVARNTCDSILLCEAAGFDVVIVETVGVGQSETAVANMVDLFTLLLSPTGGDELQGIKRGIMELSDIVVINKADGDMKNEARKTQLEYTSALKFMRRRTPFWFPCVHAVSSLAFEGFEPLWESMLNFKQAMIENDMLLKRRAEQYKSWMWSHLRERLMEDLAHDSSVKAAIREKEEEIDRHQITPGAAAAELVQLYRHSIATSE